MGSSRRIFHLNCLRRSKGARWAALVLVFAAVAIWSVWPVPRFPYTALPTGVSKPATVPMLNAWTIWWNADRLAHGLAGYWDAPIFHPETGTFAFSEPQPATLAVAPIVWMSGTPVPAYHVYLLGTLVLNAVFAVRLLRTLRVGWAAAGTGGVAMLLLPLVHQNYEAMQLMSLWGVLWTLEALVKHHRNPTWRRGMELGIAFSSVFLCCIHHGLFLALLLAMTAWVLIPLRLWKRWLAGVAISGATAALILLPLVVPMRRILKEHEFARKASNVQSLSATPTDWTQTVPGALTDFCTIGRHRSRPLLPGWIRTALAGAGVVLVVRRSRWRQRRAVVFLTVLGCWGLVWSFGMNLHLAGWRPWLTLTEWAPGFSQIRSAYRFAYFVQLVVVLLAAVGLDRLSRRRARAARKGASRLLSSVFAIACVLVAFEVPPVPVRLARVPDVSVEPPWVAFVREQTREGGAIVCLPFADGHLAKGSEPTGRWMLYGTRHRVPMVNGYSGFFPKTWFRMVESFAEEPFSESTLDMLADAGVEYCVTDPQFMEANEMRAAMSGQHRLVRAYRDESGVEVWRMTQ